MERNGRGGNWCWLLWAQLCRWEFEKRCGWRCAGDGLGARPEMGRVRKSKREHVAQGDNEG